jgi:hypothetical protein
MAPPAGVPGQFGTNIDSVLGFINFRLHHIGGSGTGGYALETDTESYPRHSPWLRTGQPVWLGVSPSFELAPVLEGEQRDSGVRLNRKDCEAWPE